MFVFGAGGDVEELVVRAPVEGLEAGTPTSAMRSRWLRELGGR